MYIHVIEKTHTYTIASTKGVSSHHLNKPLLVVHKCTIIIICVDTNTAYQESLGYIIMYNKYMKFT